MAVKIRLKRMGMKKKPFYRVVVADSACPRDGRFIEEIGYYNPMTCVKDENGNEAYMLTNATNPADEADTTVTLTLDGKYKGVLVINGEHQTKMVLDQKTATIEVGSSEGVFVIPLTAK